MAIRKQLLIPGMKPHRVLLENATLWAPWRATAVIVSGFLLSSICVAQNVNQTPSGETSPASQSAEQFRLRVESNLVVVRVVVRDAHGHPVENLSQGRFRLFDNGKEQKISEFSVEVPPHVVPISSLPVASSMQQTPASVASAPHVLALYFDDLNMEPADITYSRDAAYSYLEKYLQPSDRVAVFASSGVIKADLTSDLKALHDALFSLRSTVPVSRKQDCPRLTDFQAQHIYDRNDDENEIELALIEANLRNCHLPGAKAARASSGSWPSLR
jgi:VWFA-related protein